MHLNKLKVMLIVLLLSIILPVTVFAQDDTRTFFSVGLGIGEPTYIAGRYYINPNNAIEINLGVTLLNPLFSSSDEVYDTDLIKFNIGLCYYLNLFLTRTWDLPFYVGIGVNVRFDSSSVTRFGIVLPSIGIEKIFKSPSLEWSIYLETAAIINLTPDGEGVIDWFIVIFDEDPTTNSLVYFQDAFDWHLTFGIRFFIF